MCTSAREDAPCWKISTIRNNSNTDWHNYASTAYTSVGDKHVQKRTATSTLVLKPYITESESTTPTHHLSHLKPQPANIHQQYMYVYVCMCVCARTCSALKENTKISHAPSTFHTLFHTLSTHFPQSSTHFPQSSTLLCPYVCMPVKIANVHYCSFAIS